MRTLIAILIALSSCVAAQPRTVATNFATDLAGTPDTRPFTWGNAGAQTWKMAFHPPAGQRVRILGIAGDLTSQLPTQPPPGSMAQTLAAFASTAPQGSKHCEPCADNTPVYVQDTLNWLLPGHRAAFARRFPAFDLEADNVLVVTVAVYLNTTGLAVHLEPTATITYEWTK